MNSASMPGGITDMKCHSKNSLKGQCRQGASKISNLPGTPPDLGN
jgi:hypothetical protein